MAGAQEMTRVHIICEGQTEETFVNEVLAPHFSSLGKFLFPSLLGKPRHKGGNVNFNRVFFDIRQRLLSDDSAYCTTFIDYYGIDKDFPGKDESANAGSTEAKYRVFIDNFSRAVELGLGKNPIRRFLPYIQMHEFEGLLFSDPDVLAENLGVSKKQNCQSIRNSFATPEDINDSPLTAPSKRIEQIFPNYDKPVFGSIVAIDIGLEKIRNSCGHFDEWLTKLENLP